MNREIKFRAWDKKEGRWYKPVFEAYKGNLWEMIISINGGMSFRELKNGQEVTNHESLPKYANRFVLMQYTGLKDKNGKDIYEGDIVKTKYADQDKYWNFVVEIPNIYVDIAGTNGYQGLQTIEVVGNIYENPELIKENE